MRYEFKGGSFPVVVCQLENGEKMISDKGAMVWMTPNMEMETKGGGVQNIYTARGEGMIAYGSSFPGKIVAINVTPSAGFILQKGAFLASEIGVELSAHLNKKIGAGLFGGEGFIMQKISGNGTAFVEVDGELVEYELAPGQQMIVDTGNVLGFDQSVAIDIQTVKGVKNVLLGGEGLFNTVLTGPGRIWIQTMPISSVASAIRRFIPSN